MKNINKVKLFLPILFLITGIFNASAADVTLDFPSKISSGQMFDVNVIIDPKGEHIAGGQLDIEFNMSSIIINSITEGNFLKQSGINTFFNSGTINNPIGKAVNIYGAILGPGNVTTPGTFIIINARSIGSVNANDIKLTNVLMVDSKGEQVYPEPTPKSIVQTAGTGVVSSGGAPGGGGSGETLQEPAVSNKTLLIVAFVGIIIISILVYKYVIPKHSGLKSEIPNTGKQDNIVKTTRKKLSSVILAKASDGSIKNIAADTKVNESGINKVRTPRSKDNEPIQAKKTSKKKKETVKNTGKPSA